MSKLGFTAVKAAAVATILFSASVMAVAPTNPSLEDIPDLDGWSFLDTGDSPGAGFVIRGEDATDGDAFGRLSFWDQIEFGDTSWGPLFQSPTFYAGTGEEISVDWRVSALGGWCIGDPSTGDDGMGRGYLVDAVTDAVAGTFFEFGPICGETVWDTGSVTVPAFGDYYLLFQVGSYDATSGGVVGAQLDIDNVVSSNTPPDCSGAFSKPDMLWPPNHKFHKIGIFGVTDPEGDAFTLNVDSVFQDEPVNSDNDGDTCPDAKGIGTDTASVLAERVGGEFGYEGDGRVYWINFTATDAYGATCSGVVKVGVPHNKKVPAGDAGPLFDSSVCP